MVFFRCKVEIWVEKQSTAPFLGISLFHVSVHGKQQPEGMRVPSCSQQDPRLFRDQAGQEVTAPHVPGAGRPILGSPSGAISELSPVFLKLGPLPPAEFHVYTACFAKT